MTNEFTISSLEYFDELMAMIGLFFRHLTESIEKHIFRYHIVVGQYGHVRIT